jgi:hypothetical protein
MRLAAAAASFIAAAAALLLPARASAYEGEWHASAGVGYLGGWRGHGPGFGGLSLGHGFGGGLELGYDAKDWAGLFVAADASYHPSSKVTLPSGVLGFKLRFDVLRVIPYIGVHVGFAGAIQPSVDPLGYVNFGVPFGFDYQINRSFTVGVAGKFQILGGHGSVVPMMGAMARVAYVWGG